MEDFYTIANELNKLRNTCDLCAKPGHNSCKGCAVGKEINECLKKLSNLKINGIY